MLNAMKRAVAGLVMVGAVTTGVVATAGAASAATPCAYYTDNGTYMQYYRGSEWLYDYGEEYCLTPSEYVQLVNLRLAVARLQSLYQYYYGYTPSTGELRYQMGMVDSSMEMFFEMLQPWTQGADD
jgi:hypothetical protein